LPFSLQTSLAKVIKPNLIFEYSKFSFNASLNGIDEVDFLLCNKNEILSSESTSMFDPPDSPQIRSQAAPPTRPQSTVQIRPQQNTPVRVQKIQANAMQATKAPATGGAQLKQIVTNSSVNINNNNNNTKSNNNNKSQVSIAVISTNNSTSMMHVVNSKTSTSPLSKAQLTKSISISSTNSHPSTPTTLTKSPTFNNKTSHHEKKSQGSAVKAKDKKTLASVVAATSGSGSAYYPSTFGDDDINDVAAMGGVNLAEESQRILGSTEFVGTQIRSCKDEVLLNLPLLQQRIRQQMARHGLDEPSADVAVLISHAAQERLKNIVEKLAVIAEHRIDILKVNMIRKCVL
jgi:transcription initiation factor TFIID subunit 4